MYVRPQEYTCKNMHAQTKLACMENISTDLGVVKYWRGSEIANALSGIQKID